MLKHFLKITVTELAWRGWDLNPLLVFTSLYNLLEEIPLYLHFVNVSQLERLGADLQTKV